MNLCFQILNLFVEIPKRGPEQKGSLQEMFKNAESDEEVLDRVKVKKKRKPEFPNDSENTTGKMLKNLRHRFFNTFLYFVV